MRDVAVTRKMSLVACITVGRLMERDELRPGNDYGQILWVETANHVQSATFLRRWMPVAEANVIDRRRTEACNDH